MKFEKKYNASPFDPNDPRDAKTEFARTTLLAAFATVLEECEVETGEDLQDIAGGLLVGLVGVLFCYSVSTDENHASLRAGLLQLLPWAVDMVRSIDNLPPLSDNN